MAAAPQTDRPDLPKVFGRYLLLKRLSRGGMGEIFLAKLGEIQGFEKLVIVKKILPNLAADNEFIKRFIDEAQVAIKLSHANIAPVFEVGRVDGEYFLAIEYIEGRDLRRIIGRCRAESIRLPPDLCLYVAREIASGLAYAHRRTDAEGQPLSLVHCDVSPPNVMVSFEGEVKVIDFGIAKSALRIAETNPNMGFGKFGYMAPEQLIKGGVVDRRTDLYAAGVVLYELLTGERLYSFPEGTDYRVIARTVTAGRIVPPSVRDPRLDPSLDALVLKALASRKEDRYETGEELRDAIQTRLAQMNPTLSADGLSHFLRHLFQDEITDEKHLVESMKAVDIEPFRQELTAASAVEHTVTFAHAELVEPGGRPMNPAQAAAAVEPGGAGDEQPRSLIWASIGAVVFAGVILAAVLVPRSRPAGVQGPGRDRADEASPGATVRTSQASGASSLPVSPSVTDGAGPAIDASTEAAAPTPIVRPILDPPSSRLRPTSELVGSGSERRRSGSGNEDRGGRASHVSADAVQGKFKAVSREYADFKSKYGQVLEERWNAIATEITFGKGADKFVRVNGMLDSLRREMTRHRDGG